MCYRDRVDADNELISMVESLVQRWCDEEKSFSAYDVTTILRAKNPSRNIPHNAVREIVRDLYREYDMPANYVDTEFVLSNGVTTLVYMPEWRNDGDYDENWAKNEVAPAYAASNTNSIPKVANKNIDEVKVVAKMIDVSEASDLDTVVADAVKNAVGSLLSETEIRAVVSAVSATLSNDGVRDTLGKVSNENDAIAVVVVNPWEKGSSALLAGQTSKPTVAPAPAVSVAKTVTPTVATSIPSTNVEIRGTDSRGRLCIPSPMIESLGLGEGDTVGVWVGSGSITVNKSGGTPNYTYLVDKSRNVRISDSVLKEANLKGNLLNTERTITQCGHSIKIE